jgi:glycosyltransferase involved in cell wall biosynthesis
MIAPLDIRVPPIAYGGTELVVSLLTEELVRRGHDVTLFASGDSITAAKLVSNVPTFLRNAGRDTRLLTTLNAISCLKNADKFEIIHNHTFFEGMIASGLVHTPILTTLHGNVSGDDLALFEAYDAWYNTISHSAKRNLPPKDRHAGVIYNAVDCSSYPFSDAPREEFLLYYSRISPEKGPQHAIKVAKELGIPLVISGNLHPKDLDFFVKEILPHVDGRRVRFEGETDEVRKRELLSTAKCLLAPIAWPEPFGLFVVEAMACGTPVIAFKQGALPELISNGETGYVVEDADGMADAMSRLDRIDPMACRRRVEQNFDYPLMVDRYLEAYQKILDAGKDRKKTTTKTHLDIAPKVTHNV